MGGIGNNVKEAIDKLKEHDVYSEKRKISWDLVGQGCPRAGGNQAEIWE